MHITILAIGKAKSTVFDKLTHLYEARMGSVVKLREINLRYKLPEERARDEEGKLILKAIPQNAFVIALDENGQNLTSESFAELIEALQGQAVKDLTFIIGGSYGFSEEVLEKVDMKMALGFMTWPHLLVRGMLMEQLYRAHQIIKGHPYHH